MIKNFISLIAAVSLSTLLLNAGDYNKQAEKDRIALKEYFAKKFANPLKNRGEYFPYATDKELKEGILPVKNSEDFRLGTYAFNKIGKEQYEELNEMAPYLDDIDEGEELYNSNSAIKKCFPDPAIAGEYPMFKDNKVITLTAAINECLKKAGKKSWGWKKGKIAKLEAYFANKTKEAGKKVNIKIDSKKAMEAYERGKKEYYSQRGYLKLSCANCHVQGSGQRVRKEYLHTLYGATTHFPVYRLKWQGLGTLERRIEGCEKDEGENPHKPSSPWVAEMIYFMAYMSNGLPVDGPDLRK